MSAKIPLRTDYDAVQARALARKATDPNQVRRLLAIAAVYDDMNRRDAAAVGGMDRQSLRDWVYRFNQAGPEGLHDHKSPGAVPQLTAVERVALAEIVEAGTRTATASCAGAGSTSRRLSGTASGWSITSARSRACCTISASRT